MNLLDGIALTLSVYGAVLATILAVREIRREKRRVRIFLDQRAFEYRVQMTLTNIGHRPVTITGVSLSVGYESDESESFENVPQNSLFAATPGPGFLPVTLSDGESVSLPLSPTVSDILIDNHLLARITVYDADGKEYSEYRTRLFNEKWGTYGDLPL